MKDDFGLKKIDDELKKLGDIELFPSDKKKKFPTPKPKYTNKPRPDYKIETREIKRVAKITNSSLSYIINRIKNRKMIKLEKEALKAKQKADRLAHEIKTREAKIDSETDIIRYNAELERVKGEEQKMKERKAQLKDPKNKEVNNDNA